MDGREGVGCDKLAFETVPMDRSRKAVDRNGAEGAWRKRRGSDGQNRQ